MGKQKYYYDPVTGQIQADTSEGHENHELNLEYNADLYPERILGGHTKEDLQDIEDKRFLEFLQELGFAHTDALYDQKDQNNVLESGENLGLDPMDKKIFI